MSDESKKGSPVRTVASLLATTATAGAATALAVHAMPAALLASAPIVLDALIVHLSDRRRRRWEKWFAAYVAGEDATVVEGLETELLGKASDPVAHDVVLEGARALEDALTDTVVPHLARLTRIYRKEGRPVDNFFRGMRRVLCDLGEEEFTILREFVRRALLLEIDEAQTVVRFGYTPFVGDAAPASSAELFAHGPKGAGVSLGPFGPAPRVHRVFALLRLNNLSSEFISTSKGAMGPGAFVMQCHDLARMWPVVEPL